CIGDCNGDGVVTVNELILGVNIALGHTPVTACAAFDANHDGMVTISELIAGVNNLLYGCGVTPPTPPPTPTATATQTATSSTSATPLATDTPTPPPIDTPTATPSQSPTRTAVPTKSATRTPTVPMSVCGGFVGPLPVLCNLTIIPNPVSRSGTIAFRFGVSDLNGDINAICIELVHPPLEPQTTCTPLAPTNHLINGFTTTTPVSASPLAFGGYNVAARAFDAAGNASNIITTTFQVQ
ncbi:MAG: hypothetical protein ABI629_25060, partial [bacterium]